MPLLLLLRFYGFRLISSNLIDFKNIPELKVIDPYTL